MDSASCLNSDTKQLPTTSGFGVLLVCALTNWGTPQKVAQPTTEMNKCFVGSP